MSAILMLSCITPAVAVTVDELNSQVGVCEETKETAHQMAECARRLGFAEDHIIIQTAKDRWWAAQEEETELLNQIEKEKLAAASTWTGPKLTKYKGVNYGPTGKETYYNLPMQGVVNIMRRMGYHAGSYPYWVRDDGCKMLGSYIMVAANLKHFPRGSVVETSLGRGLVCDTGYLEWNQLDLAVNW